ncbi:hypothetical protein ACP70R_027424 [Stipagrostis hirtigluma subsp. patula]
MESRLQQRRHHQRPRSARGPQPPVPPPHHHRQNPSRDSPSAAAPHHSFAGYYQRPPMEDDAISTLMDIDDSPLNGAGFLDEEDGEGEMVLFGPPRGARGGVGGSEARGPLPFTGFYNSFDGADFDDADLD